jgi:hypothetical protein
VRQDQQALLAQPVDHRLGHVLRFDQPTRFERRGADRVLHRKFEHRRPHALRADAGDLDARVAVLDRHPLGERHGGVLGDAVDEGGDLRQQSGGRGGVDEVAVAAGDHLRQQRPRGPHVSHHVDAPGFVKGLVGRLGPAQRAGHPGVGDEHVDRPVGRARLGDQRLDAVLIPRVELHGQAADLIRDALRSLERHVGHDHGARSLGVDAARQGAADPPCPSGDDNVAVRQVH